MIMVGVFLLLVVVVAVWCAHADRQERDYQTRTRAIDREHGLMWSEAGEVVPYDETSWRP